jgi:hypothetical protein
MQCQEIDLTKHSTCTDDALTIQEKVVTENMDESCGVGHFVARSDIRVKVGWYRLPAVLLENFDNSCGLYLLLADYSTYNARWNSEP